MNPAWAHPILSGAETKTLEQRLFAGDESAEWAAMQRAGRAVASRVLRDFEEIGGMPSSGSVLVLGGKGHNCGDALIAADEILRRYPQARVDVLLVYGVRTLRPLALRAWQELQNRHRERVVQVPARALRDSYALCLDGLFGFQFRPPLDERAQTILRKINAMLIGLRAAVDLPSGGTEPNAFRADFTYATGVLKREVLGANNAGRWRYLDLGFFAGETTDAADTVISSAVLDSLRTWRNPQTEKRAQGHLFVVAGSRRYPGAALMSVTAALRSGAGLVTAFVPESLVPAFAAQVPEAIWVGWPETPDGGLALEGLHLLREALPRASAMVIGPGLGREPETRALIVDLFKLVQLPVLLDADALQPETIAAASGPLVLTPHAGEFARIAGERDLRTFAAEMGATVVLKGPVTQIAVGKKIYHSLFGGPVLARGGSGDLLAGIVGAQLARVPKDVVTAVCRGVAWHGLAADALARTCGTEAVRTTQLLDFLGPALKLSE